MGALILLATQQLAGSNVRWRLILFLQPLAEGLALLKPCLLPFSELSFTKSTAKSSACSRFSLEEAQLFSSSVESQELSFHFCFGRPNRMVFFRTITIIPPPSSMLRLLWLEQPSSGYSSQSSIWTSLQLCSSTLMLVLAHYSPSLQLWSHRLDSAWLSTASYSLGTWLLLLLLVELSLDAVLRIYTIPCSLCCLVQVLEFFKLASITSRRD